MSFILDALKKSEREREQQRQGVQPEIVYKRRAGAQPLWIVAVMGLLLLNFVFVLVLWLRGDRQQAAPVITVNSGVPAVMSAAPVVPAIAAASSAQASSDVRPLQEEVYPPAVEPDETGAVLAHADIADGPQLVRSLDQHNPSLNSTTVAINPPLNADHAAHGNPLPTLDALGGNTALNLPQLHLDIHVYSSVPAERFVFVNKRKYIEGQNLNEGPSVERITPEGAVLSYRGQRFLLPRQ